MLDKLRGKKLLLSETMSFLFFWLKDAELSKFCCRCPIKESHPKYAGHPRNARTFLHGLKLLEFGLAIRPFL
jgi:hypothetical protein